MDRYTLDNKLKRARRRFKLTATEQALYHELVMVCNEEGWAGSFSCSNGELCTALGISSEKTLCTARESLINAGLLFYQSGKSKRQFSLYSFETPFENEKESNYRKNYAQSANQSDNQNTSQSANQSDQNTTDYNINKNKKNIIPPISPPEELKIEFPTEKKKVAKRQKAEFIPPTQEEVFSLFEKCGLLDWKNHANSFFLHYDSQGWRKGTGVAITNWDSLANKWILTEKEKGGKNERSNSGIESGAPTAEYGTR